jgi:fructokinase
VASYCHPMSTAGPFGQPGAGDGDGDDGGGGILVVGECLVDLAPGPPPAKPADDVPGGVAGPGSEQPRTSSPLDDEPVHAKDGLDLAAGALRQPRQHFVAMPGGGPANVALGLARLGVATAFAGRFSHHGFGPWLRDHLAANDVDLTFSVDADEAATLAVVTLDNYGRASYTFYGPGTADWQWKDDELPDLTASGAGPAIAALHTGSLATALEPGAGVLGNWLRKLHHGGRVLISFDPNVRAGLVGDVSSYRERVIGFISSSHVVKASNEDLEVLYPSDTSPEVAIKWLSLGPSLVVITEGRSGAIAVHRSGAFARCAPPEVEVADTIGAGDAFTSGLLAYLAQHDILSPAGVARMAEDEFRASLEEAVAAGAFTCTRPGADPPTRPELTDFLLRAPRT